MNNEDIALLEKEGWMVECQSPFEIYHEETNSRATGYAAEIILSSLKEFNIDKCFLTSVLKFAKHEAQQIHDVCENDPCLGDACLTRQIIKKASTILNKLDELSDI